MTEGKIQKEIMDLLEAAGAIVIRMNSGRAAKKIRLAPGGTPDLLAVFGNGGKGKCLWIEVKVPGEKPSEVQKSMHNRLRLRGQEVIVATSTEEVIEHISGVEQW